MQSRRRLPHVYPPGQWLFLTWHLHGSLPSSRFPPPHKASAGEAFVWIDRQLDLARDGPMFLRDEAMASLVVGSLFKGMQLGHYQLGPFAVMANHVHVLLMPRIDPSVALKALKGSTAREANRILGRTGEPFWQRESYDRCVRDGEEWRRIAAYIENNPVRAGLVVKAGDYPWSSANPRWGLGVGNSADTARESACATSGRGS
jgi:putative transposase